MADTKQDRLAAFTAHPLGRIVGANAADGAALELHASHFVHEVIDRALASFGDKPWSVKEFIRLIEQCCDTGPATMGARCAADHRVSPGFVWVILPAGVLEVFASSEDKRRFEALVQVDRGDRSSIADFNDEDWLRDLAALPQAERYFRMKPGSVLGQRYIWFTELDAFGASGLQIGDKGNECRDLLGLVHRRPGDLPLFLVAYRLPARVIDKATHARPIFIDGAGHARFSVRHHGAAAPTDGAWGMTVDLTSIATALRSGLPERIARPIEADSFAATERIAFVVIGKVTRPPPPGNDERFSRLLAGGRSDAELGTVLGAP